MLKRRGVWYFVMFVMFCFNVCVYSETYFINRCKEPPIIDGQVSEGVWDRSKAMTRFKLLASTGKKDPEVQTEVMAVYDDKNVYFAFVCPEPDMNNIRAQYTKHDEPVWRDDCVELFLDTDCDGVSYTQIVVNSKAILTDAYSSDGTSETWDTKFETKSQAVAYCGKDFWSVEIMYPYGGKVNNRIWKFNASRERRAGGRNELSCLVQTDSMFAELDKFAKLILKGDNVNISNFEIEEQVFGKNYVVIDLLNDKSEEKDIEVNITTFVLDEKITEKRHSMKLTGKNVQSKKLPFDISKSGTNIVRVELFDKENKNLLFSAEKSIRIAELLKGILSKRILYADEQVERIYFKINTSNEFLSDTILNVEIKDNAGKSINKLVHNKISKDFELAIPVGKLNAGNYKIKIDLKDRSEKSISTIEETFEVIDGF